MFKNVDLQKALKITRLYTAFRETFLADYDFPGEHHDFWELVIVLDGEVGITAGNEAYTLKKGRAVLHEPMEFHRIRSVGNYTPTVIIFSFAAENMPQYQSKIFEISDTREPSKVLDNICEAFDYEGIHTTAIKDEESIYYQLALKGLEAFLLRTISRQMQTKKLLKSRTEKNYTGIINVMEENLGKSLSVGEIAELCNMSEVNLKKTFSLYAGMGVMAYFNRLKATVAISMLKNGMTVQETASALGFSNQNYFSTVFKRIIGQPPSYYK